MDWPLSHPALCRINGSFGRQAKGCQLHVNSDGLFVVESLTIHKKMSNLKTKKTSRISSFFHISQLEIDSNQQKSSALLGSGVLPLAISLFAVRLRRWHPPRCWTNLFPPAIAAPENVNGKGCYKICRWFFLLWRFQEHLQMKMIQKTSKMMKLYLKNYQHVTWFMSPFIISSCFPEFPRNPQKKVETWNQTCTKGTTHIAAVRLPSLLDPQGSIERSLGSQVYRKTYLGARHRRNGSEAKAGEIVGVFPVFQKKKNVELDVRVETFPHFSLFLGEDTIEKSFLISFLSELISRCPLNLFWNVPGRKWVKTKHYVRILGCWW